MLAKNISRSLALEWHIRNIVYFLTYFDFYDILYCVFFLRIFIKFLPMWPIEIIVYIVMCHGYHVCGIILPVTISQQVTQICYVYTSIVFLSILSL